MASPGDAPDPELVRPLERAGRAAGALVVFVGLGVLAGWALDVDPLKRVLPALVAMNPTTAVAFVLMGAAVLLRERAPRVARSLAAAVVAVGLLKLAAVAGGPDARVDQVLFASALEAERIVNRMAPNTALNFALVGVAFAVAEPGVRTRRLAGEGLAIVAGAVGLVVVVGYAYDAGPLTGVATFIPMALHTAVAFLALSFAILAAGTTTGVLRILARRTTGGALARWGLPLAITVPVLTGWARILAERAGLIPPAIGIALLAVVIVAVATAGIWGYAYAIDWREAERRRAERAAIEAGQQQEIARHKSRILNLAAHALATPITPMRIHLHLLQADPRLPADHRGRIDVLTRGVDRVEHVVRDLVEASRTHAPDVDAEPVDLGALAREAARAPAWDEGGDAVRVEVEAPGGLLVRGDAARLCHAIEALLENARRSAGPEGTVRVALRAEPGHVVVEVADDGVGFDAATAARLFQPFEPGPESPTRHRVGAGLGLAVCRAIAEAHRGSVEGRSPGIGKGATFTLRLPAAPTQEP